MSGNDVPIGKAVIAIQDAFGISREEMADMLGLNRRMMSLIMLDREPMREVVREKFHDVFGIDVYMAACCLTFELDKCPQPLRNSVVRLHAAWDQMLAGAVERFKAARA